MSISQNFPEEGPTLNLNFAGSKTLDPRITFSRTSTATYMDDSGLIKVAPADSPRFDHRYVNGEIESLGLLVEEQRINYVYDSTDPTWNSIRGGWTSPTDIISPDGTTNYVGLYTENGETGPHHSKIPSNTPAYTIADDTIVTGSAWIKNNGKDAITFGFNDKDDGYPRGFFNFNTEEVYDVTINYSLSVIKYPNDWYRFIFTGNGGSGTSKPGPILSIFMVENGTTGITGYTGDNTSGIYVWGPQLEIGSFPTSYIPTSGSTATRNPDVVSMVGDNFSDWYNQSEGTIFYDQTVISYPSTAVSSFYTFSDGTGNNRISGFIPTGSNHRLRIDESGSNTYLANAVFAADVLSPARVALAFKTNDTIGAYNGLIGFLDDDVTIPSVNRLNFGEFNGNLNMSTRIKKFTFWPQRLPDQILQTLTK